LESHFDNLKKYGFTFREPNFGDILEKEESVAIDKSLFRSFSKLFEELEQKRLLVSSRFTIALLLYKIVALKL